jgi:formylglycine-generating enzyme required for sulfatase activity
MTESQYLQHVRQMVRDFNAAEQQRKTAEERAQQTYRAETEAAKAELRRQQQILNTSKVEAKMRQRTAQQAADATLENIREDAASKFSNAKEAQKKALRALARVNLQFNTSNISFQKPSTVNLNPLTELAKAATIATETAGKIQQEIWDLERLRRDAADIRALRQKLLFVVGIAVLILVFINGSMINRAWRASQAKPHYLAAVSAITAKDWEKARDELNQVLAIDQNYKDARNLVGIAEVFATMEFVQIPAGCFQMGSPPNETGRSSDEGPEHKVCVDGFWMGKYEVTQAQWQKVMGTNPAYFKGADNPVENVSWEDAQEFINKLNKQIGKNIYRLPTEAEWEYACRAGTQTAYSFGDDPGRLGEYVWYSENSGRQTHPVGQKKPNNWGLYDMHGNVWEWCADIYVSDAYQQHQRQNPLVQSGGDSRVFRGGSWRSDAQNLRSAQRGSRGAPAGWRYDIGLRLARNK